VYAGQETGNWDIYIQSTTPGEHPINLTLDSLAEDNEPAVSRDGERIAFRSSRDGGGIFVMGLTGEGVRHVTPVGVSAAYNPAWSPNGNEIAYSTEDVQLTPLNWEGRTGLWVVNVSTGTQRSLEIENGVQASWSPHAHRIAYIARPRRTGAETEASKAATRVLDLWTIPARGGEPVQVTSDPAADWSPAWSPDGRYLYFVSDRGGSMNLWRVAIDEISGKTLGAPHPVTTPAQFVAHPSVSGLGRLIVYCAKMETGNIQRITLDPVTATVQGEPTRVTTGSQAWANPDVTADGEWVVAYTRETPEGDLYVMRSDGTGRPRQLTTEPDFVDRVPRWSPDKMWIAFFSTRQGDTELRKIRFDGSGRQQMAPYGGIAVWSPEGTRLAASPRGPNKGEERITYLLDPTRSYKTQTPAALPRPQEAFRRFIAQDWSPDGARLVGQLGFTASRGDGIVVYTFSTRKYERVAEFGEWPVWLPDSRRVLFVANGKEYWVVDTRTKRTRKIYTAPRGVLGPARLTRDGRMAVFPLRLLEADIYLLTFQD
jgi:Tol biopolymer transport system component